MQVGDTVTLISVLLQSIRIKKVISLKNANNQFCSQRFLSFRCKDSEEKHWCPYIKKEKTQGTRLANTLSRTPAYLLLTYIQCQRPCPIFWIPKLQHFSQRWNHRLVNHLNVAVISARWHRFLSCKQTLQSCTTT